MLLCYSKRKYIFPKEFLSLSVIFESIKTDLKENKVVLYMKGEQDAPQCGFSGYVVAVLKKLGVPFAHRNVLLDSDLRQGIKDFGNWPTIPQLYLEGELLGGCDIVKNLYESGQLAAMMREKNLISSEAACKSPE